MRLRNIAIGLFGILATAATNVNAKAMSLTQVADEMQVQYQVLTNLDNSGCEVHFEGACFTGQLQFSFAENFSTEPYALYFSHIAPIKWDDHPELNIKHINGDLHQILFDGVEFKRNKTLAITFKAAFWHASESDVMPNYFLVSDDHVPVIVTATKPELDADTGLQKIPHLLPFAKEQQWRRNTSDNMPLADASWLYQHYAAMRNGSQTSATDHRVAEPRIIPSLQQSSWDMENSLSLANGIAINWHDFTESQTLLDLLQNAAINTNSEGIALDIRLNAELQPEAYTLDVDEAGIRIAAADTYGLQYGFVTLFQLISLHGNALPFARIIDQPRYGFRGVHADLSRNFVGKQAIFTLLEQMFLLKLNKLHLHLADDEGWRLQIPGLPELTEVGAFRCFDVTEDNCLLPQLGSGPHRDSAVNGYLTTSDYQAILQYAHERYIEVIPSFDLPGHARAAVKAMESRYRKLKKQEDLAAAEEFLLSDFEDNTQYSSVQFYNDNTVNPCLESTYHFIDTVIAKVKHLHQQVNAPLTTYHIGADETAGAWVNSPVCKKLIAENEQLANVQDLKPMFLQRVITIIEKHGLKAAGWSDGMHKVINAEAGQGHQVNVWDTLFWGGHKLVSEFSDKGWKTVLSHPDVLYFDFPYANHPQETGYYWASKNTDSYKVFQFMPDNLAANAGHWQDRMGQNYIAETAGAKPEIAGMQSQIWTEAIRTPETFEFLMYPRLQVFAERAWHRAAWEIDYKAQQSYSYDNNQSAAMADDWQHFSLTLQQYMDNENLFSGNYRLPPPGMLKNGAGIKINHPWPEQDIQCRWDNGAWFKAEDEVAIVNNASTLTCQAISAKQGKTSRAQTLAIGAKK